MRAPSFFPPAWSLRLRVGTVLIGSLVTLAVLAPLVTAPPEAIADPRAAALLPPGSTRWAVTLTDGSTVIAEAVSSRDGAWEMVRRGQIEKVPYGTVARVERRRYWLGSDALGRDVLARLLAGGRVSLSVAALALAVSLGLGISVGLAAGWAGGIVDAVLMRLVDALLSVPMIFLLLFLAAGFRPSAATLVVVLGLSSWMGVARLVRGQVLSLKEREFVLAARGIGAGPVRIAFTHLLPNALTPVAQDAALRMGDLVLIEASLSFLGLGVQPPVPSWGSMVAEGEELLATAWWLAFLPGLAVVLTVVGAALVADGLQQLSRGTGQRG